MEEQGQRRSNGGLKEGDIGRDKILSLVRKVDTIAFLSARVADEHPFDGAR